MFQGVVHREVKTGFGSYVLKTDTLMQSTRLIFEKKSKFDTLLKEKPWKFVLLQPDKSGFV